jgi:hypothetical protein
VVNEKQPIQEFLERRYASRKPVSLKLKALVDGEERILAVRDLSQTGFLAESSPSLEIDQTVELDLPHEGRKKAKVVWAGEALAGCTFAGSISRASYSAALLKSQFLHAPEETEKKPPAAAPVIHEAAEEDTGKFPMGDRVAIMVAGGALAWAPVLALAYWVFG